MSYAQVTSGMHASAKKPDKPNINKQRWRSHEQVLVNNLQKLAADERHPSEPVSLPITRSLSRIMINK